MKMGFFFFLYDGHTSKLSAGIYELVPVYNELIAWLVFIMGLVWFCIRECDEYMIFMQILY